MTHYYNEIEPFCCAVLKTQIDQGTLPRGYVDSRDIKLVATDELKQYNQLHLFAGVGGFPRGFVQAGFPDNVRICTFGFPCQDLSVAGKRAGLSASRSGLFFEAARIIGEVKPDWFVCENVPGLLSSNQGRDFQIVVETLSELGYGLSWRILDSQYFGVAQRRRRVFIVGRFGKPCPAEILFESEGSAGNFAESREAGPDATPETCDRIASPLRHNDGGCKDGGPRGGNGENLVAAPITASYGKQIDSSDRNGGPPNIVHVYHENLSGNVSEADTARALRSGASHSYQFATARIHPALTKQDYKGTRCDVEEPAFAIRLAQTSSNGWGISEDGRTHTLDGTGGDAVLASLSGLGNGGPDDNDGQANRIISAPADSYRVRTFTGLPKGMDSPRYKALGNAVTTTVIQWIASRIKTYGLVDGVGAIDAEETC